MEQRDWSEKAVDGSAGKAEYGATGLMALVVLLIFMVCTAASLLLTLPQMVDGNATAATNTASISKAEKIPPTFHERLRPDAVGESVNPPTF